MANLDVEQRIYSLKRYLETVWLPAFQSLSAPGMAAPGRTRSWPRFEELLPRLGEDGLQRVTRIDLDVFHDQTSRYFDGLPDVLIECESHGNSGPLMLPNPDLTEMDADDYRCFRHIENEDQFKGLVEVYVLGTVSEALRLIHRLSSDVPLTKSLEFRNGVGFCNVRRPRWDMLYLPGSTCNQLNLAVFCVPPWDFGYLDVEDFVDEKSFLDEDRLFTKPHSASNKLWAAIYDVCRGRCHYFVVTTYQFWIFGNFTEDWNIARVTSYLQAPIRPLNGAPSNVNWEGRNLIELIIYWIQVSRGAAAPLHLPGARLLLNPDRIRVRA